jgi:hypothetical protein
MMVYWIDSIGLRNQIEQEEEKRRGKRVDNGNGKHNYMFWIFKIEQNK